MIKMGVKLLPDSNIGLASAYHEQVNIRKEKRLYKNSRKVYPIIQI